MKIKIFFALIVFALVASACVPQALPQAMEVAKRTAEVVYGLVAGVWEVVNDQANGAEGQPTSTYVVQAGDTLSGIAARYGTTADELIRLNGDQYPRLAESNGRIVVAGWVLVVPGGAPPSVASAGGQGAGVAVAQPAAVVESAPVQDAQGGYFDEAMALEIIRLTNAERVAAGLPELAVDDGLMSIARLRAVDIVTDFSHNGLRTRCGYCGENAGTRIGRTRTASIHVAGWMNSEGHRRNILNPDVARLGVAVYMLGNKSHAIQIFATP